MAWRLFALFAFILVYFSSCNRCREACINGICIEKSCACDEWFDGDQCGQLLLSRFEGHYKGELVADTLRQQVGFNLLTNNLEPSTLLLDSLNLQLEFYEETRFNVNPQMWQGQLISGDGQMLVESLSLQFKVSPDSSNRQYTLLAIRNK